MKSNIKTENKSSKTEGKKMKQYEYFEIREIDAWIYEDGWNWNSSYYIGTMKTSSQNIKRAFIHYLNKQGIYFKRSRTIIDSQDGGTIFEVQDRKTKQPLFAAIFHGQ